MLCAPTDKAAVVNVAVLLLTVTGEPRLLPPSWNCTVPVGLTTVFGNTIQWPKVAVKGKIGGNGFRSWLPGRGAMVVVSGMGCTCCSVITVTLPLPVPPVLTT